MIKLVATDIDGTILKDNGEYSEGVKNCITDMQKKGIKVVIVTGRMYAGAKQVAEKLNLKDAIVSYQGGLIKENCLSNKTLYETCIPKEDAKLVLDWAKQNNIHINLYINDILYVENDNETIQKYAKRQNLEYKVYNFNDLELDNINKILAINYNDADMVTSWVKECQQKFPHLYIIKSTPYFCEFSTKKATKACAVQFLKGYYNINDNEVLAIGDQDNDIELLKAGGISIAMGNGTEELKKYADFITDTVENDGFVKAMEKFVLCSK